MSTLFQTPIFVVFASITAITLGTTICRYLYKARQTGLDAELKLEMLRQGMSADEICRVIRVTPGELKKDRRDRCDY